MMWEVATHPAALPRDPCHGVLRGVSVVSTELVSYSNMDEGRIYIMASKKIRIRLKAYEHEILDASAEKIVETANRTGAEISGPIPLPTERSLYTVLRSPHKNKDSREQFEMRTHKRLIDIMNPTAKTVDALSKLELPSGVDIEIKL